MCLIINKSPSIEDNSHSLSLGDLSLEEDEDEDEEYCELTSPLSFNITISCF